MYLVIAPFPGPNSTITSALEKLISRNILFDKNLELGVRVPSVLMFFKASFKKFILLDNCYSLLIKYISKKLLCKDETFKRLILSFLS